ncbi:MAG: alginate lyase family protein [Nitrospira sp.]|nr:alginate lyase family protein [Nitrospira sp.]
MSSGRALAWYVKRLSVMQPGEVLSRVGSQYGLAVLSLRHRLGWTATNKDQLDLRRYGFCCAPEPRLPLWFHETQIGEAMSARVLAGRLPEDHWAWSWTQGSEVWHRAPDTGRIWPQRFFGSIPYREGNPYGDVRLVWEPARLQQLVVLAHIAAQGDATLRERAVASMEAQFLSWMDANPYLTGVHYVSAMECGLRLIAVCHAFDLVRAWLLQPDRVWMSVVRLVEGHADLIRRRVSLHSSLGNHTIAEAAALVYAGVLFPELPHAAEWRLDGLALLESESAHQVVPDGGGIEQGVWYLKFISDLYGLVGALLDARGERIPQGVQRVCLQSRTFLAAMTDDAGKLASIGDSDGGFALGPVLDHASTNPSSAPGLTTFEESGYSMLKSAGTSPARLILDHGPLGMPPNYAHGHADALSILFRAGGQDVLADTGTFAYSGHPDWRRYFRGTSAHNTVVVDGLDQAVQETGFQWSSPFNSRLKVREQRAGGETVLIAMHDGYLTRAGAVHWRGLLYKPPGLWIIIDRVTGSGIHDLELNWHLGLTPIPDGHGYLLEGAQSSIRLTVEGGAVTVHRGQTAPILGWRSPSYGVKEPMDTLHMAYRGPLPHEFVTCLLMQDEEAQARHAALSSLRSLMNEAQTH